MKLWGGDTHSGHNNDAIDDDDNDDDEDDDDDAGSDGRGKHINNF